MPANSWEHYTDRTTSHRYRVMRLQLEELGEAVLDFSQLQDLLDWLE